MKSALLALALVPVQPAQVVYHVPMRGPVLRHFEAPPDPYGPGHRGIDIGATVGTTVVSAAEGTVSFSGSVAGSLFVTVDHPDGIRTTSSFLSAVLVRRGDQVSGGAPVGRSGTGHPGSSEPPHLHFGARRGDDYIDPEPLIVAGLRRNYAGLVYLAPDVDGKVFAPSAWMLLIPAPARRRQQRQPRTSRRHRSRRKRSSSRSGAGGSGPTGAFRAYSAGR